MVQRLQNELFPYSHYLNCIAAIIVNQTGFSSQCTTLFNKDVKSVESQLEEYATKTLEDISNYFLQLHSFLQNEEKEIMQKFSEMCQQPQFKLHEANCKLNEYQDILNSMRSKLEYFQHKPPSDLHLGTVLPKCQDHLQQIPCQIQITRAHSNPFNFAIRRDIRQDFANCYEYSYNDPLITYTIDTSFCDTTPSLMETTSLMSSLNITHNTTNLLPQHQPTQPQQNPPKSKSTKKNNKKKKTTIVNQNYDISQTAAGDANSQASNSQASSTVKNVVAHKHQHQHKDKSVHHHQKEKFVHHDEMLVRNEQSLVHDECFVRITHIRTPENFYVQNVNDIEQIRELSHTYLNNTLANRIPEIISEGYYYMAYHSTDKQWYRGMLKKILNDDIFKIFLVDFGVHLEVSKDKLCDIEKKHLKIPFAAIRCAIYDIMPAGGDWTEAANNLLIELLQNKPARMSVIEKIKTDMLKIDLHTTTTKSVHDSFLYTGLARERPGVFSFKMQIKTPLPTTRIEERIPKNNFNITDISRIHILNIEGPQEFYAIKIDLMESRLQFSRDLNSHYASKTARVQQIYLATIQMCCAILLRDVWHRAVIEEIKDRGQLMVRLVDEGRREIISWRQAFILEEQFRMQREFAIRCTLADIEPLQANGYIYTPSAIKDFKQMASNPDLKIEIITVKQNEYDVVLYVMKKNLEINVGAALVKNKHAISTGESTQVSEYMKAPKVRLSLPQILSNEVLTPTSTYNLTKDMKLYSNKMENLMMPSPSPISSKQQAMNSLKRTPVKITHFINPGEFYIQLTTLSQGTKTFHQQIQDAQMQKYGQDQQPPQEKREWFMGNHCLVYTKYHTATTINREEMIPFEDCEWYRGIITNITYQPGEEPKFSVFLRDIGATICSIASQQLYSIDPQLDRVTNAVYCCHLACIGPTGGETWSRSALDDFNHLTNKVETLSVTLQGKRSGEKKSLPIVLWGSKTETADPLAPCITKFSNINHSLVRHGLAHMIERLDISQQFEQIEKMELAEGEITLEQWFGAFDDNALLKVIERNQEQPSMLSRNCDSVMDDNNENLIDQSAAVDHPLNMHLNEFDFKYTTNQTAPPAWTTSKVINKTLFSGYPSYIDYECIVYLHECDDKEFLEKLSKEITKAYGHLPPPPADYAYKMGQACIAKYHIDLKYYRGIIVGELNDKMEWSIQFIDYGNVEQVEAKDMRPYAPYPNLPSLASKYIIDGIKPKGGAEKFHIDDLDQIHKMLVTKLVSIRIAPSELAKAIKRCNLRLSTLDVASEIIFKKLAEPDYTLPSILGTSEPPPPLPDNKEGAVGSHKTRKSLNPLPSAPVEDYEVFQRDINMSIDHTNVFDIDEDNYDILSSNSEKEDNFDHLNDLIERLDKKANKEIEERNVAIPMTKTPSAVMISATTTNTTTGINNQPPPPKKRMFDDNDYTQMMNGVMGIDSIDINENFDDDGLGDEAFCIDYEENDDIVELETGFADNYWQSIREDMLEEEVKEINQQLERRQSYQEEQDIESEFEGFHPKETSTVFSHFSGIECFKLPQLPAAMHYFNCRVNSIITSTILQIFPHHTEFRYREIELQRSIKQMVKSSPPLAQFEPRTVCLACYSKDRIWYRALIRSYNPKAKTVDVFYVDYLNSETLPIKYIRQCPTELLGWPLRTFRVRLHGIKANPNMKELDIRMALYKQLAKRKIFAVIKKHPNHRTAINVIDPASSLSNNDIMEVALYESQEVSLKGITLYEPLIENNYFERI